MTFVIEASRCALPLPGLKPRIETGLPVLDGGRPSMSENPSRADITRRIDKAEKLLQKGKTPDALAEYLLVLQDDPGNDNVRQLAADLCLSVNKGGLAVQLMGELFDRQVAAGRLRGPV